MVPIVSDAIWGCLGVSEGESWCILVVLFEGSVHAGLSRAEANPPFWQNSEMKDLVHLIIMGHQNTKTAA